MRTCSEPGCEGEHAAKGLCAKHYYRQRYYGRMHKIRQQQGPLCSFDGCHRKTTAMGLCTAHYDQKRRGRALTPVRRWKHPAADIDPSPAINGNRGSRISQLCGDLRQKAARRGLEWNLTHEQVLLIVREPCTYCSQPSGWPRGYTGLDRVDNSRGYHPGNVVGCCKHCNSAKGSRTIEEFREWAGRLFRTLFPEP